MNMKTTIRLAIILGLGSTLAACSNDSAKKAELAAAAAMPQPYPVFAVNTQSTTLDTDYPATIEGIQDIDIRPKVDGFIEKIFVDEGAVM
jgi:membrane fusion protein (multidrug efflux system)